jgi:glycosyltransferase involved in cell wall biosynthesis
MGRVAWGAAAALAARGHEVHLAGPAADEPLDPVPDLALHPWPGSAKLLRLVPLLRLRRRIRPHIVHFHSALPHGELIAPLRLLRGPSGLPRIVVTPYTSMRSHYPKRRARLGLRAADAIIASSRWSAEAAILAGASRETTHVVHAGIDPVSELPKERLPVVVALGRLKKVKGMDVLIEAFDRAAEGRPDWTLRIGGDGADREALARQVAAAKHGDRIELLGRVVGAQKQRLLNQASIGVVPSRSENFPGTLLELQAHGLACVASSVGGIPELAVDRAALLVPPDEPGALASALGDLMDHDEVRDAVSRAALRLTATLNWDAVGEQFERVYRACLARPRREQR